MKGIFQSENVWVILICWCTVAWKWQQMVSIVTKFNTLKINGRFWISFGYSIAKNQLNFPVFSVRVMAKERFSCFTSLHNIQWLNWQIMSTSGITEWISCVCDIISLMFRGYCLNWSNVIGLIRLLYITTVQVELNLEIFCACFCVLFHNTCWNSKHFICIEAIFGWNRKE